MLWNVFLRVFFVCLCLSMHVEEELVEEGEVVVVVNVSLVPNVVVTHLATLRHGAGGF
jgi:hypothetical protein